MAPALGPLGIWTFALDRRPMAEAQEAAAELEALGYGAIWVPEAVGREPFAVPLHHRAPVLVALIQVKELGSQQSPLEGVQPAVSTAQLVDVPAVAGPSVVSQLPDARDQSLVVRDDRAAVP